MPHLFGRPFQGHDQSISVGGGFQPRGVNIDQRPLNLTRRELRDPKKLSKKLPGIFVQEAFFGERPEALRELLNALFGGEFERLGGNIGGIEGEFLERLRAPLDLSGVETGIREVTEGVTGELFKLGGFVDTATRQALGETTKRGFGPTSGSFNRARLGILGRVNEEVGRAVQGALPSLFQTATLGRAQDIQQFGSFAARRREDLENLRRDILTGNLSIENLILALRGQGLQALSLSLGGDSGGGGILGGIFGGLAGSFLGPLGSAAGSKLGSTIFK